MEDGECAICLELVPDDEIVTLPCECRVSIHLKCWDLALAEGFKTCGQSRCPTCRSLVRVDFDPDARAGRGSLVFSRGIDETHHAVVERLRAGAEAEEGCRRVRCHRARGNLVAHVHIDTTGLHISSLVGLLLAIAASHVRDRRQEHNEDEYNQTSKANEKR